MHCRRVQGRGAQNGFRRRSRTGSHVHQQLGDQPDQPANQGPVACGENHVRNETCAGEQNRIVTYIRDSYCAESRDLVFVKTSNATEINIKYHYDKTQYLDIFSIFLGFRQNESLPYKSLLYFLISDCENSIEDIFSTSSVYTASMITIPINVLCVFPQANAAYFKGFWSSRFSSESTKDEVFYTSPTENAYVPMMWQSGVFNLRKHTPSLV